MPISRTASFTAYAQRAFGPDDQQRLADVLGALSRDCVPAVLSNSYCRATLRLYEGLDHQKVPVRRAINSVGRRRGPIPEILVRTAAITLSAAGRGGVLWSGAMNARTCAGPSRPRLALALALSGGCSHKAKGSGRRLQEGGAPPPPAAWWSTR